MMQMKYQQMVREYLSTAKVMQLATAADGQPWVCSVYFIATDALTLYWLSYPERRHSREIALHNRVAVTVPVKLDQPVIGIQAEGLASVVKNEVEIKYAMEKYVEKYDAGHDFYDNFIAGTNKHSMYRFIPSAVYLFDEVHFPDGHRQVLPC
jgi:uncharacterized protein YhbP (UPF0306 family)